MGNGENVGTKSQQSLASNKVTTEENDVQLFYELGYGLSSMNFTFSVNTDNLQGCEPTWSIVNQNGDRLTFHSCCGD